MLLKKVQIQDFRCIENSGEFKIDQITCLVGKNESGKTAILKALHKLKPSGDDEFKPIDYPRRKWRPNAAIPKEPDTIATTWELSEEELALLNENFGKGSITAKEFELMKGYDNVRRFTIPINEKSVVKHLLSPLEAAEKKTLADSETVADLKNSLEAIATRTGEQEKLYQRLNQEFKVDAETSIINAVSKMVPTFLYFNEYLRLPGQISFDALTQRQSQKTLTVGDKIFMALLALAGTSIEDVQKAKTFEEFNASLRAVSNQISDQIFKYWTQNLHLDVTLRLDSAKPDDPPPFNSGSIFRTRIDNRRHRADTSFDDRSSGFVWFFSFLVWFYRLKATYGKNLIILLDEPGLTLHARAQADLLRYMKEQLTPVYQVIYTTHSPFMIDADNILSCRTVEDVVEKDKTTGQDRLLGTKVGADVLSTDPDTVSPLQRALDYDMTQSLFIGRHTLLVEGESDFLYLKWFSQQLQNAKKAGLDYRWTISIVRGIDRIPGFVSLFRANNLHIAAIADCHKGEKQKLENVRKTLSPDHLLTNDAYADSEEADIEDVLGREFYVSLVNETYDLTATNVLPSKKPTGIVGRVTDEVEKHFKKLPPHIREFDHFAPAEYLFQNVDKGTHLPGFKQASERMEKLITAVNALLN